MSPGVRIKLWPELTSWLKVEVLPHAPCKCSVESPPEVQAFKCEKGISYWSRHGGADHAIILVHSKHLLRIWNFNLFINRVPLGRGANGTNQIGGCQNVSGMGSHIIFMGSHAL